MAEIKTVGFRGFTSVNVLNCAQKHCRQYQSNLAISDLPK